jgi:hypothetical protein
MGAADTVVLTQQAVQQMQQLEVLSAALSLLQQQEQRQQQQVASAGLEGAVHDSSSAWCSLGSAPEGGSYAVVLTQQLLDSVLPAAAAAWAADWQHSSSDVSAAVVHGCCHERALQLLLLLQQPQQLQQPEHGQTAGGTAGFNMFGSYQHLVSLQQQLAQLLSKYETALQQSSSSSQWVPCRLSLQASCCTEMEQHQHGQHADAAVQQEQQPPAVAADVDKLGSFLVAALGDAVQRFKLCSADVSTAMLLKQQMATCCAEVELLVQAVQVGWC